MNQNSLAAYATVDLTKSEREVVELLAKYGPASQAELIAACCKHEARFQAMEDAQRVKAGQNLYARLHGLKKQGYAIVVGTKPDPWTGNTVDVYALNAEPPREAPSKKGLTLKTLQSRLDALEDRFSVLGNGAVAASTFVKMLRDARGE